MDGTKQRVVPPTGSVTAYAGLGGALWPSGEEATKLEYASDGDAVIIYWKGLSSAAANDLRIDIVRKFNGFPLAK